ncbi:MAG: thiamine-phosphate kinase [Blastocatellia bacterium]
MKKEFEFIDYLRNQITDKSADLIAGIGDDAAIFITPNNYQNLISTDLLIEDIHFKLEYTPANLLGYKALAVNLSDIAAMGGEAKYFLLSIARPKTLSDKFLANLLLGMFELAKKYKVSLIGGDTSASSDKLFLNLTVLGESLVNKAVMRSGAEPGDEIYVSGKLGGAALGLELLQKGKRLTDNNLTDIEKSALLAHLKPEPKLDLGSQLVKSQLVTAMIDISDGLSSDLGHICEESKVGAIIDSALLPLFDGATMDQALNGGEDYELLLTVPAEKVGQVKELATLFPNLPITKIGLITNDLTKSLITQNGQIPLKPCGYDHFS